MLVADVTRGARVIAAGNQRRKPKISIITPTYKRNGEGLLARCLDSAICQTFTDFEFIIIDDGSSDGTEAVVREYARRDDRIVYVRHDNNSGLPAIRTNEGITRARGEAIAFLFDDNVLRPDFLAKAWEALQTQQCDVVVSQVEMLTGETDPFILGGWPASLELLRNLNTVPNGGVLVRRAFFDLYGLYDPHIVFRRVCDWDLWLRAMALGAKFFNLAEVGATEHGLVSPNSLGNTIASDWKIVYSFMQDARIFAERSARLRPDVIAQFEVLDPAPVLPYVRDGAEWDAIIDTFYTPYLAKHPRDGFDPRLPSNRIASIEPSQGWNADWALIKPKFRIVLVSNTVNSWTSAWVDALRRLPGAIVMNCPEWQLSAFAPPSLDLVVLFDCAAPYLQAEIAKHRDQGVPILYALGCGVQDETSATPVEDLGRNPHISKTVGAGAYFARPGVAFDADQAHGARQLAGLADLIIARPGDAAAIGLTGPLAPLPAFAQPHFSQELAGRPLVAYGRIAGVDAIERVSSHAEDGARVSDESLGALVEARPGAAVIVEPSVLSALPPTERIGLGILAARRDVSIIATAAPDPGDAVSRQTSVRAWQDWMVNLAQAARLAALIRGAGPHHRPLRVAVALNSEMIAGSEIYGVMLARNLTRLGVQVDLLIPNCTPYGDDADVGPLNALLRGHGLSPAIAAPYVYGDRFNGMNPAEQAAALSGIDAFLLAGRYDIVVSSAYIPALTGLPKRRYLAITALFQASAYRQSDLAGLRGQVSGIISDSAWSLRTSSRVIGGPAAVVRSTTPFQGAPPVRSFVDSTRLIRIAVGGTLQPRKRQIEAIAAVGLLVRRGFSVELNLYGHELSLLQAYIDQLDDQIVKEGLIGRVRRKGLRDLDEIALENDIILSASIDESLPQTLIELMARGLVAVCGLSGGIDELVRDGETGYLTRDLSAGGLADALQRAIEDRGRWGEIRTAAFALIAEDYSEGATTTALLNLLIEAAAIETAPSGRLTGVGA